MEGSSQAESSDEMKQVTGFQSLKTNQNKKSIHLFHYQVALDMAEGLVKLGNTVAETLFHVMFPWRLNWETYVVDATLIIFCPCSMLKCF